MNDVKDAMSVLYLALYVIVHLNSCSLVFDELSDTDIVPLFLFKELLDEILTFPL